jgi:Fe-Mn family superoxide dismutase
MEQWNKKYTALLESNEPLVLEPLDYNLKDLAPVLSEENVKFHHNKLARAYVDRYNNKEGDSKFNEAGAYLHNIFFAQFKEPSSSNKPKNNMLAFIEKHFESYELFKEEMLTAAMTIQGSGWVYLAKDGRIKTITNHQIKKDIVLLIDWWEHSWYLDYGPDKKRYLKNMWRIIDWDKITLKLT